MYTAPNITNVSEAQHYITCSMILNLGRLPVIRYT